MKDQFLEGIPPGGNAFIWGLIKFLNATKATKLDEAIRDEESSFNVTQWKRNDGER